jgi:hypothetical protein
MIPEFTPISYTKGLQSSSSTRDNSAPVFIWIEEVGWVKKADYLTSKILRTHLNAIFGEDE